MAGQNKAESDSDDGLPDQRQFHMRDFEKTGIARREIVMSFVEQLKTYGYALVQFYDEDEETLRSVHDSSLEFFGLPSEEKEKVGEMRQENGQLIGYGASANREQMELRVTPDNKPYPCPDEPKSFEKSSVDAYKLFTRHGKVMLEAIEEARKMEKHACVNLLDPDVIPEETMTNSVYRICNYSAEHSKRMFDKDASVDVVCEDHTDIGLITLDPCSPNPGLQVRRSYDGVWEMVERTDHKITDVSVMVGDTLEQVTNGYLKATRHRVVRPQSGQRVGMPFLLRGRPDATLPNMTASVRMVPGIKSARSILKNWFSSANSGKKDKATDKREREAEGEEGMDPKLAVEEKAGMGSALFSAVKKEMDAK